MRRAIATLVALCLFGVLAAGVTAAAPVAHPATATHHHKASCVPLRRHRGTKRPVCHVKHHGATKPKPKPKPKAPAPKAAAAPQPTPTANPALLVGPAPVVGTPVPTPAPTPTPPAPAPLPSRLGVDEQEYSVYPTHNPVATGSVEFDVSNFGQDDHNLTVARAGVVVAGTAVVHPGEQQALTVDLAPGTYKLYCSLYDHEQLGMVATLVVQ